MSDAAEALKRWAWAFHNGDYTNAPQAVADLRGAARYIAELEAENEKWKFELDDYDQYTMCDCCEALHTGCVDAEGHMQCPSCCRIAELEARLQPHKAGRTNTAEMARAMYQKQSEYVGPQHEEECVRMLTLAFDSFEDRIAELEAEVERQQEDWGICPDCGRCGDAERSKKNEPV